MLESQILTQLLGSCMHSNYSTERSLVVHHCGAEAGAALGSNQLAPDIREIFASKLFCLYRVNRKETSIHSKTSIFSYMTTAQIQKLAKKKSMLLFNHIDLSYKTFKKWFQVQRVTNDAAERVVKMLSIRL